jgi:hypothetical protein
VLDLDPASGSQHGGMTTTRAAIEVVGLTKSYGEHTVRNGVDLTVIGPGSRPRPRHPNGGELRSGLPPIAIPLASP